MKFEGKNLSPVAFHALTCVEDIVSIKCFDWIKMAAEVFPVARIDAKLPVGCRATWLHLSHQLVLKQLLSTVIS